MSIILFDISGKIDPLFVRNLFEIKKVADSLAINFFVVGATARDFVLEHCYNIKSPRSTRDIDLGVEVADISSGIFLEASPMISNFRITALEVLSSFLKSSKSMP